MVTPDDVTLTVGSSSRLIDWICAGSRLFSMEIKKEEKFAENPTGILFFYRFLPVENIVLSRP